ncbi:MAG: MarR family transcriptional regulator [Solirubrobacteraceae bacterium]
MTTSLVREHAVSDLQEAVSDFSAALRRLRSRDFRRGGLSLAQWQLVRRLAAHDELPAGKLAADAGLTPATVTQTLDALAAAGLVERVRSETDRRVTLNRLTAAGRERYEAKYAEIKHRWADALSDFPADQLEQSAQVLARMASVIDDL